MNQTKTYYDFFKELSAIPRASGNEGGVQNYLLNFAAEKNLEAFQEEGSGNIVIKKPATKGYEHISPVILQSHMDMVAEKAPESSHNFDTDPIELIEEEGFLHANHTTLGADNGIGVAYSLALLFDDRIEHPALEAIFTTEEETTMKGAELLKGESLSGRYMLNLDSEEEGVFCVSSAGGLDFIGKLPLHHVSSKQDTTYKIVVSDLKGGHSGMNINSGRANANKLLGRLLNRIAKAFPDMELVSVDGGSKMNAIPRDAQARFNLSKKEEEELRKIVELMQTDACNELQPTDKAALCLETCEFVSEVMEKQNRDDVISFLLVVPNGVNTMSKNIHGLVESSQNLGIVTTEKDEVGFYISARSSVDSLLELITERNHTLSKLCKVNMLTGRGYPAWEYKADSPLRDLAIRTYETVFHKEAKLEAIHAGLECGYFAKKIPGVDIISLGPNIYDVHSPKEKMELGSADRMYDYVVALLKEMTQLS
ncbi:MAG: aminoacyl-histidine dipeptidase [Filifactor alocis]|nr:aminoacyl-histidine dipeptidase [Filifactor alocis]